MLTNKQAKELQAYTRHTPVTEQAHAFCHGAGAQAGPMRFLPLLATLHRGQTPTGETPMPVLLLQGAVMKVYSTEHESMLTWTIPITEGSFDKVVALLANLGWTGKIWPRDGGWPDGVPEEATGLIGLLSRCGLAQTFSFPPDPEQGSRVIRLLVGRNGSERFPLPIEPYGAEDVPAGLADSLRELMGDVSLFMIQTTAQNVEKERVSAETP